MFALFIGLVSSLAVGSAAAPTGPADASAPATTVPAPTPVAPVRVVAPVSQQVAPQQVNPQQVALGPQQVVCKRMTAPGSRIGVHPVCHTRADWERIAHDGRDMAEALQVVGNHSYNRN